MLPWLTSMRIILIAAVVACAAPASATPPQYSATPIVQGHRQGQGGSAHATMDVEAPPAAVWSVLSDCANAGRFMRDLISCRILQRGRNWELREHRIRGWILKPVMRNVLRVELTPNRRLSFRRVEGDWSRSQGAWSLTSIDHGRGTHVDYHIDAALNGPVGVPQSTLLNGVRNTLLALRSAVLDQRSSRTRS